MSHARSKPHHNHPEATVSAFDADLRRHLRALELDGPGAYRAWCRAHGFGEGLTKTWQERRAEREAFQKVREAAAAHADAEKHWRALGLGSAAEYEAWCRARGISTALHKGEALRRKERASAEEERGRAALTGARAHHRRPDDVLQALHDGTVDAGTLKTPALQAAAAAFATAGAVETGHALLRLLRRAQARTKLFHGDPAFPHLGPTPGNTFIAGLAALARHHGAWLRPPEDWTPDSHNAHKQFGSLARHLLASYAVPPFLDAVWCAGDGPEAAVAQGWFLHIGQGRNIRTAPGLPLALTRRAAHLFQFAPADLSAEAALRWAQVKALDADERLIQAILGTRLGQEFEHEAFWVSVLHFFVNHPMLDPACVGPMVDYIHHVRFVPRPETGEPAEPEFSMKGRSPLALQARVDAWHQELAREERRPPLAWAPSGIAGYRSLAVTDEYGDSCVWTVEEILTGRELSAEGKAMHHCVASYARSCAKGHRSIWTIQVEDGRTGSRRRVMTVEVQNAQRQIVQARGRCNKVAGDKRAGVRLAEAPHWLAEWARHAGLTVARHV